MGSFRRVLFRLAAPSENGAFRNSREHAEEKKARAGGDLRNYGRWKTSDLPGDRHLDTVVHQVYGIALHARLARRSKETNRFTSVPVAECLGTIYPDNIAAGTLFTYNEMHIVAPFLLREQASGGRKRCG